jgi:hypothetical protein
MPCGVIERFLAWRVQRRADGSTFDVILSAGDGSRPRCRVSRFAEGMQRNKSALLLMLGPLSGGDRRTRKARSEAAWMRPVYACTVTYNRRPAAAEHEPAAPKARKATIRGGVLFGGPGGTSAKTSTSSCPHGTTRARARNIFVVPDGTMRSIERQLLMFVTKGESQKQRSKPRSTRARASRRDEQQGHRDSRRSYDQAASHAALIRPDGPPSPGCGRTNCVRAGREPTVTRPPRPSNNSTPTRYPAGRYGCLSAGGPSL